MVITLEKVCITKVPTLVKFLQRQLVDFSTISCKQVGPPPQWSFHLHLCPTHEMSSLNRRSPSRTVNSPNLSVKKKRKKKTVWYEWVNKVSRAQNNFKYFWIFEVLQFCKFWKISWNLRKLPTSWSVKSFMSIPYIVKYALPHIRAWVLFLFVILNLTYKNDIFIHLWSFCKLLNGFMVQKVAHAQWASLLWVQNPKLKI